MNRDATLSHDHMSAPVRIGKVKLSSYPRSMIGEGRDPPSVCWPNVTPPPKGPTKSFDDGTTDTQHCRADPQPGRFTANDHSVVQHRVRPVTIVRSVPPERDGDEEAGQSGRCEPCGRFAAGEREEWEERDVGWE
jgi:hypothetical protein